MSEEALQKLMFVGGKTLPMIRQNEAAECGNACLAMVAGYYGYHIDIAGLRRRFPTSARGLTLRMMSENAGRIGLASRGLKANISQLNRLKLPAVLHWDLNHFVVLKSISRTKAVVHDPARGVVSWSIDEFSEHYTGVALELTLTSGFKQQDAKTKLKFASLWDKLHGLGSSLAQLFLLSVFIQAYAIAAPQYLQMVVDTVLPSFDLDLLLTLALGFGLFLLINVTASVLRQLVILFAGSSMGYQIAINLFSHLVRLPLSFFERRHVGDVVSRFQSIDPIKTFLTEGLVLGIVDGVMAVVTLALMFAYQPLLALVSCVALALYLTLRLALFRSFRNASEEQIVTGATENSNFMETVRGIQAVKSFSKEGSRQQQWQNLLADSVNQSVRVQRLTITFNEASQLIKGLEHVILIYLAAGLVMEAEFTIGMIFAFMAYRTQFTDKTTRLVELLIQFRMLDLHLERISDIALETAEPDEGEQLNIREGRISVRNVTFSYEAHLPSILQDVSIDIEPGECVALTGPSGSGKTTLLKLMMGLLSPTGGEIHVDGTPLSRVDLRHFRGQIACVMQDDVLFAGSLAENITFFDPDPDIQWAMECAQVASIYDDIQKMPMGFDTPVGDMGSALSGGQLQRVLLARAIYRKPAILFVDEGTSNLDVDTERCVNQAISQLGVTRVIVAHRPETIRSADRALRVVQGRVTHLDSALEE